MTLLFFLSLRLFTFGSRVTLTIDFRTLQYSQILPVGFAKFSAINIFSADSAIGRDTGRKVNVHKTFRGRLGRLLNVLCTFSLRPASTGSLVIASSYYAFG